MAFIQRIQQRLDSLELANKKGTDVASVQYVDGQIKKLRDETVRNINTVVRRT